MSQDPPQQTEFIAPELEELNELIPTYEFVSFIAKGGMGAVYLARQNSLDRLVAIKVLPPVLCQNAEFKASFETEAKLMAKLNHPNLIGIYDFGDVDGMLYIVMEYVKGQSLFHSAYGKMIEQETAVSIISGVCEGLEHAHEAGMLHRDVKPANILLNKKAVPKIGDFGLARPSEMTETGMIFGTPDYSAPEVLGAPEKVDKRTDLFAVGVILYELMTGKLPGTPYVSVTEFADTDSRFDAIIQKAINPNIELRYATTRDLVVALDDVLKTSKPTNRLLVAGESSSAPKIAVAPSKPQGPTLIKASSRAGVSPIPQSAGVAKSSSSSKSAFIWLGIIGLALGGIFYVVNQSRAQEAKKIADEKARQEEVDKQEAAELKEREKARIELELKTVREKAEREKAAAAALVVVSPLEKLAQVKEKLARGERPLSEMPDTIFKRTNDTRILMFIKTPMTWEEADVWAEECGGHIAVCSQLSDLPIFSKKMEDGVSSVWLGGGKNDEGWSWIDGTPWSDSIALPPSDKMEFLTLSSKGTLGSASGEQKLPFFIEWKADGTNPASREKRSK